MSMLKICLRAKFVVVFMLLIDELNCAMQEGQRQEYSPGRTYSFVPIQDVKSVESPLPSGSFKRNQPLSDYMVSKTVSRRSQRTPSLDFSKTTAIGARQRRPDSPNHSDSPTRWWKPTLEPTDSYPPAGPALIDWRTSPTYPRVRDQHEFGYCGSCWAFAPVSVLEILYSRMHRTSTYFSYQHMIDCCPDTYGCQGARSWLGLECLVTTGVTLGEAYPYEGKKGKCRSGFQFTIKTKTFEKIENDEEAIVQALRRSPLVAQIHSPPELKKYKKGVADLDTCKHKELFCNHVVVIVGHGKDYWILRNSWGEEFGASGHYLLKKGTCGVGYGVYSVTLANSTLDPIGISDSTTVYPSGISGIEMILHMKKSGICPS